DGVRNRYPLTIVTGDREKSYHHSRFRDQPWALKVSPAPLLFIQPETARDQSLQDGDWVRVEIAGGAESCRLKLKLSENQPQDVVSTGMGWWRPAEPGPSTVHSTSTSTPRLPIAGATIRFP